MVPRDAAGAVERHGDTVYRLACARTGNRADADDVFQDVFLAYITSAPEFLSSEHEKAWLLRTAINRAAKLKTSAYSRRTVPLREDSAVSPAPEYAGLAEAVRKLPPKLAETVWLFYYEDKPAAEIALLTGQSEAGVRMRLTRARRLLRNVLSDEEGGDIT